MATSALPLVDAWWRQRRDAPIGWCLEPVRELFAGPAGEAAADGFARYFWCFYHVLITIKWSSLREANVASDHHPYGSLRVWYMCVIALFFKMWWFFSTCDLVSFDEAAVLLQLTLSLESLILITFLCILFDLLLIVCISCSRPTPWVWFLGSAVRDPVASCATTRWLLRCYPRRPVQSLPFPLLLCYPATRVLVTRRDRGATK